MRKDGYVPSEAFLVQEVNPSQQSSYPRFHMDNNALLLRTTGGGYRYGLWAMLNGSGDRAIIRTAGSWYFVVRS